MSDDRVTCSTCCLCSVGKKRCMEQDLGVDITLPRRCILYIPTHVDPDSRNGRERWPDLQKQIEQAREEDRLFHGRRARKAPINSNSKPGGR